MRVAGGKKRAVPLAFEEIGKLCGRRGLTGALKANEHDHVGRAVLCKRELGVRGAEQRGELVQNNADDVLRGGERVKHLGVKALLLAARHEVLDHAEVDVGLEQGEANLAHGDVDVILGETTLAAKLVKGVLETIGKRVEHSYIPSPTSARQKSRASKVWRSSRVSPTPMR